MKRLARALVRVASAAVLLGACGQGSGASGPPRDVAPDAPDAAAHEDARFDAPADRATARDAVGDGRTPRDAATERRAKTCADGAPVAYTRTSCPGGPTPVPAALATALAAASRGDVVPLSGLDVTSSPCVPVDVCVPAGAPTLLFSDEPESPSSDGVLYADLVGPGAYRAYVYHTNAGSGLRKFPVVLLNQGTSPVHVTVGKKGIAGPSTNYVAVGKQAVLAWLSSTGGGSLVVPPGARVLLDADLDAVHAGTNELAHGIVDFALDGEVKASVVSVASSADATVVTAGLGLLPNTGMHLRGSFPGAALELEATLPLDAASVRHVDLGGGVTNVSLSGHDYVDGTSVTLDGDYGVPYAIHVALASKGAVLVSPQGGAWGGAGEIPAGADAPAGLTALPAKVDSLGAQTKAIFAGRFTAGSAVDLVLMTAGGSSLPIDVATAPLP